MSTCFLKHSGILQYLQAYLPYNLLDYYLLGDFKSNFRHWLFSPTYWQYTLLPFPLLS